MGGGSNFYIRYREKSLKIFLSKPIILVRKVVTWVEASSGSVDSSLFKSRSPGIGFGNNDGLSFYLGVYREKNFFSKNEMDRKSSGWWCGPWAYCFSFCLFTHSQNNYVLQYINILFNVYANELSTHVLLSPWLAEFHLLMNFQVSEILKIIYIAYNS